MTDPLLYGGCLHSPFFIFIRQPHGYSDTEILALFKLSSYQRSTEPTPHGRHAIMADAGDWSMLADDWYYTLWHMKTTRPVIEGLAEYHEVYICMEGDCDRSFDFVHYRKGKLARKYVVSSPSYSNRVVAEDFGTPLPGEAALLKNDGYNIGIELAGTLGIKNRFTDDDLRIYTPPRDAK
ncbi:MAG: hypothetical protein H6822_25470 [Planctomycetaceae bacterium]|nr:hypothetical protein [Planctomycetaceae bacterium]